MDRMNALLAESDALMAQSESLLAQSQKYRRRADRLFIASMMCNLLIIVLSIASIVVD